MARLRQSFQRGAITSNPLGAGGTSITSPAFAGLVEVASPDILPITLDPEGAFGAPEIVYVTAHAAAATSVTVIRAQEGTTAREHPSGTVWRHGSTVFDFNNPFIVSLTETENGVTSGTTETLDVSEATVHSVTLDDDCAITFAGAAAVGVSSFTLVLIQDSTGGHTATFTNTILWAGGSPPSLSTGADEVDVLTFFTTDAGVTWYGFLAGAGMA